jgi:two-component system, NtrC family, nitrogen regulation response regulator NtrX
MYDDTLPRYRDAKRDFERQYLRAALERHGGHIGHTAEAIGLSREQVHRKMSVVGLRIGARIGIVEDRAA